MSQEFPASKIPGLKPVLFFHIDAAEPCPQYSTSSISMTNVVVTGGFIKSLDEKFPFDATIEAGADDIRFDSKNPSVGKLDCRLYLNFAGQPKGFVHYTGVVQFKDKVNAVVGKEKSFMEFDDGYVTNHPQFFLDDSLKSEKWVDDINFIGKGRFIRDSDGGLKVQYYAYTFA